MGFERAYSCIIFLNWYKSGGEGKKWRGGENLTLLIPPKNGYLPTTGVVERQKF
jgi:hypothetical protein